LSGPEYVAAEHDAIPDVASLPCHVTDTGWLNQPLKSAARAKIALTPVGGSASTFRFFVVTVVVPPSLVAEHVRVVPLFGPAIASPGSQPEVEVIGLSGSLTDQLTVMKFPEVLPRYQPFVPTIPYTVYVTIGAVVSLGTWCPATALKGSAAAARKQIERMLRE
jgi:hypothetical protein